MNMSKVEIIVWILSYIGWAFVSFVIVSEYKTSYEVELILRTFGYTSIFAALVGLSAFLIMVIGDAFLM